MKELGTKSRVLLALSLILLSVWAFADNIIVITFTNGTTKEIDVDSDSIEITFNENQDSMFLNTGEVYRMDSISYFGFKVDQSSDTTSSPTIYVTWNGTSTPTVKCSAPGVTYTISGTDVAMTNTNEDTEYTYVLDGSCDAGSFTLTADYKSTIQLNGLTLKSNLEEALNIKCGKRVALELVDGTTNTLADATTDNGQKAALYCKGHLEISGGGTLNLTGNIKHGISTKEYCQIKKTCGTINVTSAAGDGIHAGQYFQMNGGTVTINNVKGDGIQAEATGEEGDEKDGQMLIKGGTLNITTTSNDVSGIKSDSLMLISDGTLTINCSGNGSKGIKSSTDVQIDGGTFNITNSGGLYEDTEEEEETTTEETKSYKVYVAIPGSTGGGGGWGGQSNTYWSTVYLYKSDGTLVSTLTDKVNITSGYTTTTFYYYDFKSADSGTYYFASSDYTSRNSNTTYHIKSGTFSGPTSGSDVYYSISSSYTTASGTRTFSISNVTSTYSGGTSTSEGDLSSSHGIKGDNSVTINNGDVTIKMTGTAGKGISSDMDIFVYDGTVNITNSGAGSTSGTTNYTAKGFTADHNVSLIGGTIYVTMSGTGGKGVKSDYNIYIGNESDGTGPTLSVVTSGSSLGSSTSTGGGGWGGGMPGGESSGGSSAKAMKCTGSYYQYGGEIYVKTATDGAEGIESKTSSTTSMNFIGGNLYMVVYDDCINSAGQINFSGANIICYSTGNDAIDSNYGKAGAVTISDGTIIAFSQKGGAEMGLDCDNMSYVKISGGTVVAGGGSQGGTTSSLASGSTHYKCWSTSLSYTAGRYYSIVSSSNNVMTFLMPCTVSSSLNVYAGTEMSGSTVVYYNTTAPASGTAINFHRTATGTSTPLIWKNSDVTSGTQLTTFSPS